MPIILIVDDVMENVRLLKNLLQDFGQIVFARDGLEALVQAQRHRPDIVVLDVMMPGLDGYETCRRLKAEPQTRDIPVIFITGADGESDEARGLAVGAIDYITKPFAPAIVRARVQNHLALVRATTELRQANDALRKMEQELRRLATTDALTGIANRRCLMELGAQELQRAQRTGEPVCVLMLDIDHFKQINDSLGHPAGDAVIQALAGLCSESIRTMDAVGRLGGEEFAILLPATGGPGALELAERLRIRVAAHAVPWEGTTIRFTVSIGVAQRDTHSADFAALIGSADQALYRAKNTGRNRVVLHAGDRTSEGD